MINDIISKIRQLIESSPRMAEDRKDAVLILLEELRTSLSSLPEDDAIKAANAAHLALDQDTSSTDAQAILSQFESRYPHLVAIINKISSILSGLGV